MDSIEERWRKTYTNLRAFWVHDGNPRNPHARLTKTSGGMHSSGVFNSGPVTNHSALLGDAASDLLELFLRNNGDVAQIDGVVGPQKGATKLAERLRNRIHLLKKSECFWASPAKGLDEEGGRIMVFTEKELDMLYGKTVLVCEDVITTGGSADLVKQAVTRAGGSVDLDYLALVNRSGMTKVDGHHIIALINHYMPTWKPEDCPLCPNSEPLPKSRWDELMVT